jgi:MFS family permease
VTATTAPARALQMWSPLRVRAFRALWLAVLVSNLGSWMQTVGAQWLLVDRTGAEALVALVYTATTLPVVLLAIPAGVLADILDRTRLLLGVQLFIAAVAVTMTVLTAAGAMEPSLLLVLTFALGAGAALTVPAISALIPDLVPRSQLVEASALGAININASRAIGPALAGLVIARAGVTAVFALNALSALVFIAMLVLGRIGPTCAADDRERFTPALRAGGRYVRHTPVVRRILLRSLLFVVPATALWSLLPLVARRELRMGPDGYGLLLGALGIGAIIGALVLPQLAAGLSTNRMIAVSSIVYAGTLVAVALLRNPVLVAASMVPAGIAWVAVLANVNAQLEVFLPGWVRARGLCAYLIVVFGGQAVAAIGWGLLARQFGLRWTFLAAAVVLSAGVLTFGRWPLHDTRQMCQEPAVYWPEPHLMLDPDPSAGPVMVTLTYTVRPERQAAFIAAMAPLRGSRQRSGASMFWFFQVGETPDRFVEASLLPSWDEHLRQHFGRQTEADREQQEEAFALADGPPEIKHLLPVPDLPSPVPESDAANGKD